MNRSKIKRNRGMTYVELIVVLSIFAIMSGVALFNHSKFEDEVNIKNLANDVALKIVQAQKAALAGKYDSRATSSTWKPAYGVYFNIATPTKFVYFVDLDNDNVCDAPQCLPPNYTIAGEVLDIVNITSGNSIPSTGLGVAGVGCPATVNRMSMVFRRPNSTPTIFTNPASGCTIGNIAISVTSPQGGVAQIKLYSSGRVQID